MLSLLPEMTDALRAYLRSFTGNPCTRERALYHLRRRFALGSDWRVLAEAALHACLIEGSLRVYDDPKPKTHPQYAKVVYAYAERG